MNTLPRRSFLSGLFAAITLFLFRLRHGLAAPATITGAMGIDVRLFGAKGDNIADDTAAIQAAINQAIIWNTAGLGTFEVLIPPGKYKITSPILVINFDGTSFNYFSITIRSHAQGYTSAGRTQILPNYLDRPAFILQQGRNIRFEGFSIIGGTGASNPSYAALLNDATSPWWNPNNARDNNVSPYCAIAVDPFLTGISSPNQYPGLSAYYVFSLGSSGLFCQTMEFNSFIVGVGLSLAGNNNDDRVTFDACDFSLNKVGVSLGSSQNRGVMLRNCGATGNQVIVDNLRYGSGNSAGFTIEGGVYQYIKAVFFATGNVDISKVNNAYFESTWMIGVYEGFLNLEINYCNFKLIYAPQNGSIPAPDFHLLSTTVGAINFRGGYVGHYLTAYARLSFIHTGQVTFEGVGVNGEICSSTTSQVRYLNCATPWSQKGTFGLSSTFNTSLTALAAVYGGNVVAQTQIDAGGIIFDPTTGYTWKSISGWDSVTLAGGAAVAITANGDGTGSFSNASVAAAVRANITIAGTTYFWGDYIQSTTAWTSHDTLALAGTLCTNMSIGQVSSISGSTVNLVGMPLSFVSGNYGIQLNRLPQIRQRSIGTTTSGSPTITSVTPLTAGVPIWNPLAAASGSVAGDRIKGSGIPQGAYVTATSAGTLTLSKNATASATVALYDALLELADASALAAPSTGTWIQGDFIKNSAPTVDGNGNVLLGWECTVSGTPGTWITIFGKSTSP